MVRGAAKGYTDAGYAVGVYSTPYLYESRRRRPAPGHPRVARGRPDLTRRGAAPVRRDWVIQGGTRSARPVGRGPARPQRHLPRRLGAAAALVPPVLITSPGLVWRGPVLGSRTLPGPDVDHEGEIVRLGLVARAALATALLLAASACGGSDTKEPTSVAVHDESPSASPSPTATPPQVPTAARNTTAGRIAFATYFVKAYNYAFATNDASPITSVGATGKRTRLHDVHRAQDLPRRPAGQGPPSRARRPARQAGLRDRAHPRQRLGRRHPEPRRRSAPTSMPPATR